MQTLILKLKKKTVIDNGKEDKTCKKDMMISVI